MYFTSGSDRAFEQLMQGKPGFDHYDSGEAVTPEDCGTCRFYRPHWKYQFCVYAECPYQPGKLTAYDAVTFRVKGVENMAVFRVERNKGYTVMSNHHLRNKDLSLKAKGLLSQMLSLPEDWDYTLKGLSLINREQIDAIRAAIRELEQAGYIVRSRERDSQGRLRGADYVIYEQPQPVPDSPTLENPMLDNPTQEKPTLGKPTQLNKDISSKEKSITDVSITDPIPILSRPSPLEDEAAQPPERKGTEAKSQSAIEIYREIIMDNIEYEHLCQHVKGIDRETLDEIVDLLVETVCSARKTIRIAGDDYPAELVKSKFMKLDSSHIEFVFDCLSKNTSEMLIVQDQIWGRVTQNRSQGKATWYFCDEFHLLLREEQTAAFSCEIWKRFRKWGGIPTGATQNVKDLLSSPEIENILENSDFICLLNQASGDRRILAERLNISPQQLRYVDNSEPGEGLLIYENVILPFRNPIPQRSQLYKIMTTRLGEGETV